MEKFIVCSKEYREIYAQFMRYLHAIGYSDSSCKTFDTGVRDFLCWLERSNIALAEIGGNDVEDFYNHQQERCGLNTGAALSESCIEMRMYIVSLLFQYLQDTSQFEINPMGSLQYRKGHRVVRENLLTVQDVQRLYDECQTGRERSILGLVYGCGLRKHEMIKLNAKDVQIKNKMLYVREGKGGRKRCVPLSDRVAADFKEYYYSERPGQLNRINADSVQAFMLNKHGNRMQDWSYQFVIRQLLGKAQLNSAITLHHFRHAIATHLLENGMKLEHVKDFLGHKSIETTQTYTHITTAQLKKTTGYGTTAISA